MSAITARVVGVCIVAACAFGALGATAAGASDTVLAWGENNFGQLGDNSTAASAVPVAVCETNWTGSGACTGHDLTGVEAIASGARQGLALLKTGEVVAWGENNEGELGNGTTVTSHVPVPVCEGPGTCLHTCTGTSPLATPLSPSSPYWSWPQATTSPDFNSARPW